MCHKRVVVTHYGGPEVITVVEEDIPTPKVGEIRVKVLAAGVSLPDVLAREGVHPETPRVPYTPGWDLVGIVDLLGERRDWLRTAPDSRRHAHPWVLRTVRVRAPAQACPRACGLGRS
jgi:NADPH:quinone reductase-like Zn-dependent oxidoreductase